MAILAPILPVFAKNFGRKMGRGGHLDIQIARGGHLDSSCQMAKIFGRGGMRGLRGGGISPLYPPPPFPVLTYELNVSFAQNRVLV